VRTTSPRILSREGAAGFARNVQSGGGIVVFTNGVFDLLHPGHVRYLNEARQLGNALIIGVNSDRSVRANKGPARPINGAEERAEVLLALAFVDAVVVFDEDTPLEIISAVQPDVLVKGADWGPDNIVGREVVERRGGRVVRIELAEGLSTSHLIGKMRPPATP
jgi:rfaE bifunctional protein nucleotidyltransferase chain/domain